MKKIKPETEALLLRLCMEQKTNSEIAAATGLPIAEVYAWRSRNNLTRAKVKELLEREREAAAIAEDAETILSEIHEEPNEDDGFWIKDMTGELLRRTNGTLDGLLKYILGALGDDHVCDFCKNKENCDLQNCAPALADFLREELEAYE